MKPVCLWPDHLQFALNSTRAPPPSMQLCLASFMEVSVLCLLFTFVSLGEGGQNVNKIGDVTSEGQLVELLLSDYEKSSRPVLDVSGGNYDTS